MHIYVRKSGLLCMKSGAVFTRSGTNALCHKAMAKAEKLQEIVVRITATPTVLSDSELQRLISACKSQKKKIMKNTVYQFIISLRISSS